MKRRNLYFTAAILLLVGLYIGNRASVGIGPRARNEIVMRSKNFIRRLNRHDYEACYAAMNEDMTKSMSLSRVKETFVPVLDALGDFNAFRSASVSRRDFDEIKRIACSVKCEYDNGNAVFTILFDPSFRIAGLSIK